MVYFLDNNQLLNGVNPRKARALSLLLLPTLLSFPLLPCAALAEQVKQPIVVEAVNDVTRQENKAETWEKTQTGQALNSLDKVKTGVESRAQVDTHKGIVRLYQNALLVIPELKNEGDGKTAPRFSLKGGAGIFRFPPAQEKVRFEVQTNQVTLVLKGTVFSIITEGKELYEQEITKAIRSFTAMDLSGAAVVERWVDPSDGTVHSLVKLDRTLMDGHISRLGLSKPAGIYVRKAFSSSNFRLEAEKPD